MSYRVLFDACALFPQYLNDLLMRLALAEQYHPLWSPEILDELRRNLSPRIGPAADHRIERMTVTFPSASVTDYEQLIDSMTNDPKDRHVVAAAVRVGAEVIVTYNIRDFPDDSLRAYDITALHPDTFLAEQLEGNPQTVLTCLNNQVAHYSKPPNNVDELLDHLEVKSGLPEFAKLARHYLKIVRRMRILPPQE